MRRGRTVQIKMSSATAWTESMTTLPFVSLPANCSTLLWPQLQRSCPRSSWRFGGESVSSCQQNAVDLLECRWQADNHREGIPGHDRTRTGRQASSTTRCNQCSWRMWRRASKQLDAVTSRYTGWQKRNPLPIYQKIVLNRIKVCKWD